MPYFLYVILAILIAVILMCTRPLVPLITVEERAIISASVGWCMVVYGLILAFSISNFYTRYISIRDTFVTEVINLQIIYRIMRMYDDTEDVKMSIYNYVKNIHREVKYDLMNKEYPKSSEELYYTMNSTILKYVKENENFFNANMMLRLSTDTRIKKLIDEIKAGNYYIEILSILLIFIIIPLWLSKMKDRLIQFIIDSCLLIILFSILHLLNILNNPFCDCNPLSLNLDMYSNLASEIEEDLKDVKID